MARRIAGCLSCRKSHSKCDGARPICAKCRKSRDGRQCTYVNLDIRPSKYVVGLDRQLLETSKASDQILHAPPPVNGSHCGSIPEDVEQPVSKQRYENNECERLPEPPTSHVKSRAYQGESIWQARSARSQRTSESFGSTYASLEVYDRRCSPGGDAHHAEEQQDEARRIVSDAGEAQLLGYYIKESGFWLDAVCPERHFSQVAPYLALSDPLLYSACLAYSSLVLSSLGQVDKAVHEQFSNHAIELMVCKLSEDPSTWSEGSVLTTSVLLRVAEQFSEICDDQRYHLNGAFSVLASAGRRWSFEPSELKTTSFWTYLRMSVRMCFLCERTTEGNPETLIRPSDSEADDSVSDAARANQMTFLLAKICNACWPASREVQGSVLESLRTELKHLRSILPSSFAPWGCFVQPGAQYPVVKYLSSWHVIFWQFFHAADVLLAANTALLRPLPTVAAQSQYAERHVLKPTRDLLALTYSNSEVGLQINGAALVAWCGQFLTREEEQTMLLHWLRQLSADTAWPSRTVSGRLCRIWAGEQDRWTADPKDMGMNELAVSDVS